MKPPLVSAILPFFNPRRLSLARKAVNNFIRQHYTPYELVVVNGTDTPVLTNQDMDAATFRDAGCSVLEVRAPEGLNAAAMRNRGIEAAHGDWIFPIDDDDWCHPQRLTFQMAHRREGQACLLQYQLRVDVSALLQRNDDQSQPQAIQPLLHLLSLTGGIPSTILFPRLTSDGSDNQRAWFYDEDLNVGEHDELLARIQQTQGQAVVCDNMHNAFVQGMQWPILSVAIYHGNNELTYEQFFTQLPESLDHSVVPKGLTQNDMDQLLVVLQSYNFKIN